MKNSNLIGIDVSDSSIKVLQLDAEKNITAYGTATLDEGVVTRGHIIDKEIFSAKLTEVLNSTKPTVLSLENTALRAVLCLPESKLFTHYLAIPATVRKTELEAYIKEDAAKIIPFELEEMYWDYHIAEKKDERHATFIGVAKADLDNYVEAFTYAKVRPAFVVSELFSLGNALLPQASIEEDHIIVDIGAHASTIGLFADDVIANASIVVPVGGDFFTKAVAEALEIPLEEAEKQKRQYGIDAQFKKTGVPEAIQSPVAEIISKLQEARVFFEKKTGNPIAHIIVAGGSALLPGICAFIEGKTGIKTSLADPLAKISNHAALEEGTPGILFANVVGLALYGINTNTSRINLLTQYRYDESDSEKELLAVHDIRSLSDLQYVIFSWKKKSKDLLSYAGALFQNKFKIRLGLLFSLLFLIVTLSFLGWVILKFM